MCDRAKRWHDFVGKIDFASPTKHAVEVTQESTSFMKDNI